MKTSKGEEQIIQILRAAGVKFEREKTYTDLKGGRYRFDFYLPAYNILIEVDGKQHFEQVTKFQKTRAEFLKQQENDRRKNSYCLANNITLLRIPYWELENLTYEKIFNTEKFIVKSKWFNDHLIPPDEKNIR